MRSHLLSITTREEDMQRITSLSSSTKMAHRNKFPEETIIVALNEIFFDCIQFATEIATQRSCRRNHMRKRPFMTVNVEKKQRKCRNKELSWSKLKVSAAQPKIPLSSRKSYAIVGRTCEAVSKVSPHPNIPSTTTVTPCAVCFNENTANAPL